MKQPKIVEYKNEQMLVSTPDEVQSVIAAIPPGQVMTLTQLRQELAHRHGVTVCCAMSTAIFLNQLARADVRQEAETGRSGLPWWRVLRADGTLNDKFPGGRAEHARRLRAEGVVLEDRKRSR